MSSKQSRVCVTIRPIQSVPCYFAKELSRLLPLSIHCFDVSSLMKNIESDGLHLLILQESHETLMKAQIAKYPVRGLPESVSAEQKVTGE